MKNYLLLVLMLGILFVSCKKDNPEPEKTETQHLTEKTWKPYQYKGSTPAECQQNDVLELTSDKKVSYDPKETYCSSNSSIIPCDTDGLRWYGKWSLDQTKEIIFEEDGGSVVKFQIKYVSEDRLELFNEQTGFLVFKH